MNKKLAICAKALTGRSCIASRLQDPEWDVWGMNDLWAVVDGKEKWDAWFEVHGHAEISRDFPHFIEWYKKQTAFPVYSIEPYPGVPKNELLDVAACLNWLRKFDPDLADQVLPENYRSAISDRDYVASAVGWMLLEALHRDQYEEIEVLGVEMQAGEEYGYQRPNCTYLIGLARGLGIKVRVPKESSLLRVRWVYGVENPPGDLSLFNECFFRSRLESALLRQNEVFAEECRAEGSMRACHTLSQSKDPKKTLSDLFEQSTNDFSRRRDERMRVEGIVLQLREYMERARTYNQDMRGFLEAEAARTGSPVPTCTVGPGEPSEGAAK